MADKRKISKAVLVQDASIAQFVVQQLLKGLRIKLKIDGKSCIGHVHKLDFSKDSSQMFANVAINEPGGEELICLRVAIFTNGDIQIVPDLPACKECIYFYKED